MNATHLHACNKRTDAVEWPLAERNRILGLLAKVLEGHRQPGRGGVLVVEMPAFVAESIRQITESIRPTVQAPVTRCADCGSPMYAGTRCGQCAWEALDKGPAA